MLYISCGASNGKNIKIEEANRISSYVDIEASIKTSQDTLTLGDEVLLTVKYVNKTDNPVYLNLDAFISITRVIPPEIFIFDLHSLYLRIRSGKENLILLSPQGVYLQTFPLVLENPWCVLGKNEYYVRYLCNAPRKKEPPVGVLFGDLFSSIFEIYIWDE